MEMQHLGTEWMDEKPTPDPGYYERTLRLPFEQVRRHYGTQAPKEVVYEGERFTFAYREMRTECFVYRSVPDEY